MAPFGKIIKDGIEMGIGVLAPLVLLSRSRVRRSANLLLASVAAVIFGIVLNRINVFLIAYNPLHAEGRYFPSLIEIAVTIGLAAVLILVYRAFVMMFPILPQEIPSVEKSVPVRTQAPVE